MTADFGLAVRYKASGETDYTVQPVSDTTEQDALVRHLRADRGIDAEPVALAFRPVAKELLTADEREDAFVGLDMADALTVAEFVKDNYPAVFDAAAAKVARIHAQLAEIHAQQGETR